VIIVRCSSTDLVTAVVSVRCVEYLVVAIDREEGLGEGDEPCWSCCAVDVRKRCRLSLKLGPLSMADSSSPEVEK